jgi:hypothetical protein
MQNFVSGFNMMLNDANATIYKHGMLQTTCDVLFG